MANLYVLTDFARMTAVSTPGSRPCVRPPPFWQPMDRAVPWAMLERQSSIQGHWGLFGGQPAGKANEDGREARPCALSCKEEINGRS